MRSSLLLLSLLLAPVVVLDPRAQAQPPLPAGAPAAPAAARSSGLGIASTPAPTPAAPGVMTLSDVARQASTETPAAAEASPFTPSGNDMRLLDGPRPTAVLLDSRPVLSIVLARISTVGADTSAVLWVKGRLRKVSSGARVLQYTVGDIRDEGVCLNRTSDAGKGRNRCQELLTFVQGI